jgi:predicted nucleic acid-binding protein
LDKLLTSLSFETVIAPREPNGLIVDPKDAPILNAAILAEVDIILSGDKHFLQLNMDYPKVLTPTAYVETMMSEI